MTRIIPIFTLLLVVAACDDASVREAAEAARAAREAIAIAPERGSINGLHIGSSEAEILAAFGPPARAEENIDEIEGKPARTLFYDGIEVYLVGDEIYRLDCGARFCVTLDGIGVGDSARKVMAVYGQVQTRKRGDGREALAYPLTGFDAMLILDVKDGKVVALSLFFDYV